LRGGRKLRVWPAYFDARLSRGEGRRVPRGLAVRDPQAVDIERAALELGLEPVLVAGAAYSRQPWRRTGVVLVEGRPKSKVLRMIAGRLKGE